MSVRKPIEACHLIASDPSYIVRSCRGEKPLLIQLASFAHRLQSAVNDWSLLSPFNEHSYGAYWDSENGWYPGSYKIKARRLVLLDPKKICDPLRRNDRLMLSSLWAFADALAFTCELTLFGNKAQSKRCTKCKSTSSLTFCAGFASGGHCKRRVVLCRPCFRKESVGGIFYDTCSKCRFFICKGCSTRKCGSKLYAWGYEATESHRCSDIYCGGCIEKGIYGSELCGCGRWYCSKSCSDTVSVGVCWDCSNQLKICGICEDPKEPRTGLCSECSARMEKCNTWEEYCALT